MPNEPGSHSLKDEKSMSCDGLVISECMLILLTNSLLLKLSGLKHYLLNSQGVIDHHSIPQTNKNIKLNLLLT